MKNWFESLDAREQLFVSAGAVVVIIVLAYALLWIPFDTGHRKLRTDVANLQQSLAELKPLGARVASSGQGVKNAPLRSQKSPIIIVDETLQNRNLDGYRRRSQPTTNTGIRVEFENVAFDELVVWLGDLSDQYSMHVQAGSFTTGSQAVPGRINATVTLEQTL